MEKLDKLKADLLVLLNGGEGYSNFEFEVKQDSYDLSTVRVRACAMYGFVPLNFGIIKMISDALGTENIDDAERTSEGGCESCDYGSRCEWTLVCKDCKLE